MTKKYEGLYLATVQDNKDEQKRGRLRLHIPSVIPNQNHPAWAEPIGFSQGSQSGSLIVPELNTVVCVMFLEGDPSKPFWFPGPYQQQKAPELANNSGQYPERVILYEGRRTKSALWIDKLGEMYLRTKNRLFRLVTEGGHVEIDSLPDGKVKINRPASNMKAVRNGDPVNCGTLTATAPPGGGPVTFTYTDANGVPQAPSPTVSIEGKNTGGSESVLIGN